MTNYLNQDLRTALEKKDYKAFRQALFSGADPNLKEGEYDLTIAMLAVVEGDVMALKILLEHGVDLDIKNKNGETALDIAKMIKSVNEKKGRPTSQIDEIIQLLQDEKKIQTISLQEMDYSIPGFPSKVGILQMEADVISGAQVYNLSRDRWAMDVGFHYFPDGEQKDAFFETFRNGTIDREMEVYKKAVPSADLFRHFRERTLKALAEKDNLTDAEKKVQRILSARYKDGFRYVYQVNSFYDFAMKTGVLTTKAQETPMHDEDDALAVKKINELNRTKIETAFAMHYYMDALGSSGLPQPKFQGYGTFKKHAAGLVQRRTFKSAIGDAADDLRPEAEAYSYLFHLMTTSPRWLDVCTYMSKASENDINESSAWQTREPYCYDELPRSFYRELTVENVKQYQHVENAYKSMQYFDLGLNAVNSYKEKYVHGTNGGFNSMPYFSLTNNRNDGVYNKESPKFALENASVQGQNSVADFSGNVYMGHKIVGYTMAYAPESYLGAKAAQGIATAYKAGRATLSTRYAVAGATVGSAGGPLVSVAGAAAGIVLGYVVEELVLEAIEPVFTYIKATRFDDAYAQCQKINTRVETEIENLSTKFQELSPYMDALTQEEKQAIESTLQESRKKIETALQEALSQGFESMKNEDKALYEKFTSSEYGPRLRAEMEKMAQNYLQQELTRLKFATYATRLNEKQKQQIQRENPEQFNQMVAMAQTTNSAPTDADVRQFLSRRIIPNDSYVSNNQSPLSYLRAKGGYDESLFVTQKYLLDLYHNIKRTEAEDKPHNKVTRLPCYPLLGAGAFKKFKEKELSFLRAKDPSLLSDDEKIRLDILTRMDNAPNELEKLQDLENQLKILEGKKVGDLSKDEKKQKDKLEKDIENLSKKKNELCGMIFNPFPCYAKLYVSYYAKHKRVYYLQNKNKFPRVSLLVDDHMSLVAFEGAIFMYAQAKSAIGLPSGLKIFPNRVDVVRQARTLGVTDYQLAAQFLAEKDVCLQLINGLSKAPDFEIICQKNGWVDKDGKPDLSMIDGEKRVEPQPTARVSGVRLRVKEDKKPQTAWDVMIEADQAQTRLETLFKAFEKHRSVDNQTKQVQNTQSHSNMVERLRENAQPVGEGMPRPPAEKER